MNAIPQKLHNYQRIQMPKTPAIERTRSYPRVESLDVHRQARVNAMKRQELAERSRRMAQGYKDKELDCPMVYRRAGVPRQVSQRPAPRKLTAAYEVGSRAYRPRGYDDGYYRPRPMPAPEKPKVPGFDMYAEEPVDVYVDDSAVEQPKVSRRGVVSTIVCIALIFVMLAMVLMKYAELSNITYQNAQSEKRIAQLERDIDKANMAIALGEDLGSIQQRAAEMGMSYPKDGQIVYLPPDAEIEAQLSRENAAQAGTPVKQSTGAVTVGGQDVTTPAALPVTPPAADADQAGQSGVTADQVTQSAENPLEGTGILPVPADTANGKAGSTAGETNYFDKALNAMSSALASLFGMFG